MKCRSNFSLIAVKTDTMYINNLFRSVFAVLASYRRLPLLLSSNYLAFGELFLIYHKDLENYYIFYVWRLLWLNETIRGQVLFLLSFFLQSSPVRFLIHPKVMYLDFQMQLSIYASKIQPNCNRISYTVQQTITCTLRLVEGLVFL